MRFLEHRGRNTLDCGFKFSIVSLKEKLSAFEERLVEERKKRMEERKRQRKEDRRNTFYRNKEEEAQRIHEEQLKKGIYRTL